MKEKTINLLKHIGETPFEVVKRFREKHPEYSTSKIAFAGRLDPLAEGVLILLVDDECKKRDLYQNLPKEYVFKILFGFATDTYDVLGKVTVESILFPVNLKSKLEKICNEFIGEYAMTYPPFSSKTINGVPLYRLARGQDFSKVVLPTRKVSIYALEVLSEELISKSEFKIQIEKNISLVKGDFRQKEILETWKNTLKKSTVKDFPVFSLKLSASSGTYVRSIVEDIGKRIGLPALTFSICRTRVGKFELKYARKTELVTRNS